MSVLNDLIRERRRKEEGEKKSGENMIRKIPGVVLSPRRRFTMRFDETGGASLQKKGVTSSFTWINFITR